MTNLKSIRELGPIAIVLLGLLLLLALGIDPTEWMTAMALTPHVAATILVGAVISIALVLID